MSLRLRDIHWQFQVEEAATARLTRALLLGSAGFLATFLLVLSPETGSPGVRLGWLGVFASLTTLSWLFVPRWQRQVQTALLRFRLRKRFPLEWDVLEACAQLGPLPDPLGHYVDRVLNIYARFQQRPRLARWPADVPPGWPLTEVRDNVLQFLHLVARAQRLRETQEEFETTLSDRDLWTLRQRYLRRCEELHQIVVSFEQSLSHFVMAHVAAEELDQKDLEEVAQRMGQMENEMEAIKQGLYELAD